MKNYFPMVNGSSSSLTSIFDCWSQSTLSKMNHQPLQNSPPSGISVFVTKFFGPPTYTSWNVKWIFTLLISALISEFHHFLKSVILFGWSLTLTTIETKTFLRSDQFYIQTTPEFICGIFRCVILANTYGRTIIRSDKNTVSPVKNEICKS